MGPTDQPGPRRGNIRRLLFVVALTAAVGGLLGVAWHQGLPETLAAVVLGVREAGPVIFFLAMALLPAVGFPLLAFTLAAGPVFGPTLGPGWVIAWSLAAVVANLLLTYWITHRALRPLVSRWMAWCGFRLPTAPVDGAWQLTLIVRLTPGPPFWAQSYLLGLLRVPLVPYLVVSTGVLAGYIVALVSGGAAMTEGNGRMAFAAIGGLVVVVAALQLLRRHTLRKRERADAASLSPQPLSPK